MAQWVKVLAANLDPWDPPDGMRELTPTKVSSDLHMHTVASVQAHLHAHTHQTNRNTVSKRLAFLWKGTKGGTRMNLMVLD